MSAGLILIWVLLALAGLILVFALLLLSPAHAIIEIDTAASLARAKVRPLWGLAPEITLGGAARHGVRRSALRKWRKAPRLLHALLVAPKLIGPVRQLLRDIAALKPRASRISAAANAAHPTANLLIDLIAGLPASLRQGVEVTTRDGVGLDLAVHLDATASPLRLYCIAHRFRSAPGVREFARRLSAKPLDRRRPRRHFVSSGKTGGG
jgi:hypothetical protein